MARTIQSPGVEIKEVDLSLRPQLPVGTTIFIPGFASQGPTDEVIQVASLSEFEQIYGKPTNAAERYYYHTVRGAFQSPANILTTRLPYGSGAGDLSHDKYSALVYPVIPLSGSNDEGIDSSDENDRANTVLTNGASLSSDRTHGYVIAEPTLVELTTDEYNKVINQNFTWSEDAGSVRDFSSSSGLDDKIGKGGIVILNTRKNVINEGFEGLYVALTDNTNLNPATDFDGILKVNSLNKNSSLPIGPSNYVTLPETRLTFPLSAAAQQGKEGSISEVMENLSEFDLNNNEFSDTISIGVFKIRQSTLDPDTNKLDYILTESYTGSLNFFRQKFRPDGGNPTSFFIENESKSSNNIKIFVNPYLSKHSGDWLDTTGTPEKIVRVLSNKAHTDSTAYLNTTEQQKLSAYYQTFNATSVADAEGLYPNGIFKQTTAVAKNVGSIPGKLDRAFELVDNFELYPIDIVLDGGLSTIFVGSEGGTTNFDDEKYFGVDDDATGGTLYSTQVIESPGTTINNYRTIFNRFNDFAQNKRKDMIFVSDSLRYIFIQGQNAKTLDDKNKNFSQHIYWPLRHIYGAANTSYASAYANWIKVYDEGLNKQVWAPISGRIGAMYANTDSNFFPWFAPAGFTRGTLGTVNDLALYPKQKHRDQLYKIKMNPVANFPNDGFVVFGQKTLQSKPSAFDRINVRRLFLFLEKATRSVMKYFVFEPNTLFTRSQIINVITPIFEQAKNTQGLFDYLIICDERNNTPDVIDRNELVVDIYLKPVRAAEFILVNFYATRTGQDFSELVS